jgi:hypothetical protein
MAGKPNKNIPIEIQSLARGHTRRMIQHLAGIADNGDSDSARVSAISQLLDRGWGKPDSTTKLAGPDGKALEIIVRTIVQERPKERPK